MSTTTAFLVVAALLLTGLAATPAEAAHNYFRRFPGRYRGRGWWQRRYSPPATATPTPTTPPPAHAQQCTCAPSPPATPGTGTGGGARSAPADVPEYCLMPLVGMMSCGFLSGSVSSADAPAPGSQCCAELSSFLDSTTVAGGGGDTQSQLNCLCPVIRGEVRGIDPLRMVFLPIACGVVIPPQVVPVCLNTSSSASRWETTPTP